MTPSLCGSFLSDKRSLVAFTWTIATLMTIFAFLLAIIFTCQTHTHYRRMGRYYEQQYENGYYNNQDDDGNRQSGSQDNRQDSADRKIQELLLLGAMSSKSMTFVALYTMAMAVALSLTGSTAIVGFTSLRGVYIAPCFSSQGSSKLRLGMFGGAIVIFANLLLVCAVVFGEVRVEDWREGGDKQQDEIEEPYELERLATILAVTCMFLSALYTVFSVLLFLYFGGEDDDLSLDMVPQRTHAKPLVSITEDPRMDKFITMADNST